jgi:hypothetical protein
MGREGLAGVIGPGDGELSRPGCGSARAGLRVASVGAMGMEVKVDLR